MRLPMKRMSCVSLCKTACARSRVCFCESQRVCVCARACVRVCARVCAFLFLCLCARARGSVCVLKRECVLAFECARLRVRKRAPSSMHTCVRVRVCVCSCTSVGKRLRGGSMRAVYVWNECVRAPRRFARALVARRAPALFIARPCYGRAAVRACLRLVRSAGFAPCWPQV